MNIVFLDAYTTNPGDVSFQPIADLGQFTPFDASTPEEGLERGRNAEVIIVNKFLVNEEMLSAWTACKMICVAATGYNNIDLEECAAREIRVCNVSGYSTDGVAQHVFAALLAHFNRPYYYAREVDAGRWIRSRDFCFYDHSISLLAGKTLGILGFGSIGKKVAQIGLAFGMKVKTVQRNSPINLVGIFQVSLDDLLEQSDVLTIHVPLTEETEHFFRKKTLEKMKPGAVLVNTSRGGVIHEADLANHLSTNPEFTALLDVLDEEPQSEECPLSGLPNCRITPHLAWAALESRTTLIREVAENIQAWQEGRNRNRIV